MRRIALAATLAVFGAFVVLGVACAPSGPSPDNRGWSQMMMGPMAGCPMGAGNVAMMGPNMMGYGGQGMMGRGAMGWDHMGAWRQGSAGVNPQIDSLRGSLAIRPDQQDEWDAYAAAARADSQSMFDMYRRMIGFMQGQSATARDWLSVHRDMLRARADSLDALAGTVDRLYAGLDAEQKANFDRYGGGLCGAW